MFNTKLKLILISSSHPQHDPESTHFLRSSYSKILYAFLASLILATFQVHHRLLYLTIQTTLSNLYKPWCWSIYNSLNSSLMSFILGLIFSSALCFQRLLICFPQVRNHFSHPYETAGKSTVLYIVIWSNFQNEITVLQLNKRGIYSIYSSSNFTTNLVCS
jgi:hypothetical protein